ncbi:TPA: hypothetical protein N0F65_012441 [Lagenidium giganteum]|uniref:Uncharacterized protein n=1 Tax=Lagenidium giganteum TaxID=4803 RepID=A0AAV2YJ79_9STRA|nr:TPA: hypothetical protein N0F65_012441 [Lagenidium giganteum]
MHYEEARRTPPPAKPRPKPSSASIEDILKEEASPSPLKRPMTTDLTDASYQTPERARKRRGSALRTGSTLKPLTPTADVKSSMNASLVYDMVTSLSTNDPGVAIATLRSMVVLGKEYPSNLLFDELIDRIQSTEAVAYDDAVAIYSALVFVFDKASECSCALSFPHQWEPLANALQDVSVRTVDEVWRRNLLVVRFYTYCFVQDAKLWRTGRRDVNSSAQGHDGWIFQSRLFQLLRGDETGSKSKAKGKVRNNLILQAIGCAMQLWHKVFDSGECPTKFRLEGEDACLSVLRLIELLYRCSDQVQNILQRIQAGLADFAPQTRAKFAHALQSPELKIRVATYAIGLTNKSRSKENEWLESNAIGRVLQGMNNDGTADLATTDHYSWAHFDSLLSAPAANDFASLLQDIARVQQSQ